MDDRHDHRPPAPPGTDVIWCRRCAAAWVIRAQTAVVGRVVYLDPEPAAAGLYRLTPGGLAEAVVAGGAAPGEDLYSPHVCSRVVTADDRHDLGGEGG